MAGRQKSFSWKTDTLTTSLKNAPKRIDRAVTAAVEYQATRSENYMRKNAPWNDQTTNARNGLTATPIHAGDTHIINLSHSVPYGIWLEVRWSGKYGIIPQSVRQGGMELMALLSKLFQAMDS